MDTIEDVNAALLDAFRDTDSLERMVRFGLDENLRSIAHGRDLTAIVFRLTDWAESHGKLSELVQAAKESTQNELVRRLDVQPGQRGERQEYRSRANNVGNWELLEYRLSELDKKVQENQRVSKENQRKIDQIYLMSERGPDLLKTPESRILFGVILILLLLIFGVIVAESIVIPYFFAPDPVSSTPHEFIAVPARVIYRPG